MITLVTDIVIPHQPRLEIFTHGFSDLASYQAAGGGYIETIHLDGHALVVIANEEGKVMRLPANRRATCLWRLLNPSGLGGDTLVGNIAIVGPIQQGEMSNAPASSSACCSRRRAIKFKCDSARSSTIGFRSVTRSMTSSRPPSARCG